MAEPQPELELEPEPEPEPESEPEPEPEPEPESEPQPESHPEPEPEPEPRPEPWLEPEPQPEPEPEPEPELANMLYRVVHRGIVREGFESTSTIQGTLEQGDIVRPLELRVNDKGQQRVRFLFAVAPRARSLVSATADTQSASPDCVRQNCGRD